MKLRQGLAGLAVLAGLLAAAPARAGDPGLGLEVGCEYDSRYVFRGLDLLAGEPTPAARVALTRGGLAVYYYGYLSRVGDGGGDYEEHDLGAEYTLRRDRLSLVLGGIAYTFRRPREYADTAEAYGIASLDVPLAPTLSLYYDTRDIEGAYASFGVSHTVPLLPERLGLGLSATAGYDLGYYSKDFETSLSHGWNDLLLGAVLSWQLSGRLALAASARRSLALEVLDAVGQPDETFYTVGATFRR